MRVTLNGIRYSLLEDGTALVSGYEQQLQGEVDIPDTLLYQGRKYSVTCIGIGAFDNCIGITAITIPNSVINIEKRAFNCCMGLTAITIPDSIMVIEYGTLKITHSLVAKASLQSPSPNA